MSSGKKKSTYRDAGVDIDAANRLVKVVSKQAQTTFTSGVLSDVGFFGGLFELKGYREPVLVSSTDGVGTKIKIACALGKHDTIGVDLANHCVNDILTCGASPLFFQDYIAMSRLDEAVVASVVQGMSHALGEVGCALIGGETAEMPDVYPEGEYDLVGFIVGVVEKHNILNGSAIEAGDAIIGVPSSGLHTNGYSLARKVFHTDTDPSILSKRYPELDNTLGDHLLNPHRCYHAPIKPLLPRIKGLAHITGGGIPGNLARTLPDGLAAKIGKGSWQIPPIFSLIQTQGNIEENEMYRVFNMGIGMVVICSPEDTTTVTASISGAITIGEIMKQKGTDRVLID